MSIVQVIKGKVPLLISMPHNGFEIPADIAATMNKKALRSVDTDWHLDKLYDFAQALGCWMIMPKYSRYVIDLNRSPDDISLYPGKNTTELCPTTMFDLTPIYRDGKTLSKDEIDSRVENFWLPYHNQLANLLDEMKGAFKSVILFEAHSIKSEVPRFFDGKLSDLNIGTFDGRSCCTDMGKVLEMWQTKPYSKVINDRFKGGYITRHYGDPINHIESVQLEISQSTYLNESNLAYDDEKAKLLKPTLQSLIISLLSYLERKS